MGQGAWLKGMWPSCSTQCGHVRAENASVASSTDLHTEAVHLKTSKEENA